MNNQMGLGRGAQGILEISSVKWLVCGNATH